MRVFTVKGIDGRLDIAEDKLPDGTTVTLLLPEPDHAGFTLSERAAAIRQADRQETVDGRRLLADLEP